MKTPVLISYLFLPSFFFLSLILSCLINHSSYALFHALIYERDCTSLQGLYESRVQSDKQLPLSRLMHSMYCCSAVYPYQALEGRTAQDTLVGCAGLHNNSKALNFHFT